MTPPTDLGKEPPGHLDCGTTHVDGLCNGTWGDYWRRRALAAEGLLREAWKNQYLVEWEARVAQHFAGAEGEK